MTAFRLRLLCNDEEGNFMGKLAAIELSRGVVPIEEMVTVECSMDGGELPVTIGPAPTRFTIGTRWWLHHAHRRHSGNLLWDELVVSDDVAAFALNYVSGSRTREGVHRYEVKGGLSRLVGRVNAASVRSIDLVRA